MVYQNNYDRPFSAGRRLSTMLGSGLVLLVLGGLFAYGVYRFQAPKAEVADELDSIADVLTPSPIFESVQNRPTKIIGQQLAKLTPVTGRSGKGTAARELMGSVFFHYIKAALPAIEREAYFYEGWLVRPVPFDYFSTGEMVTNDLGEFVLQFEGDPRGAYEEYTRVVITLEKYDGNPDPADHILEGEFTGEVASEEEFILNDRNENRWNEL